MLVSVTLHGARRLVDGVLQRFGGVHSLKGYAAMPRMYSVSSGGPAQRAVGFLPGGQAMNVIVHYQLTG